MSNDTVTNQALRSASELEDLLEALARHRGFLTQTLNGLTDEQAGSGPP